jgi:hypothetical protein
MDLKQWCKNQAEQAKKHKWCKGVELGKDPGEQAIIEWVNEHAKAYRKEYNQCLSNISQKVFEAIQPGVVDIDPIKLKLITDLVIEEFTKEWTKEAAIEVKHINEI